MKYILKRTLTTTECPWLLNNIKKDTIIFEYTKYTYGCISPTGIACSLKQDEEPFFEVPRNSIKVVD